MSRFKKYGINNRYPDTIETWRKNEKLPEWIIDECKVKVDDFGEIKLQYRENSRGGMDIFTSGINSVNIYVSTKTGDDYVCRDIKTGRVFSLNPTQLDLLYIEA